MGEENLGFQLEEDEAALAAGAQEVLEVEYKDEGYIELVLKVLAQMCDGQFVGLQV